MVLFNKITRKNHLTIGAKATGHEGAANDFYHKTKGKTMKVLFPISPQVLNGITAMLSANIQNLTPKKLLDALESYDDIGDHLVPQASVHPEPPYTRKKAAEFLNVSLPTIDRYLAAGLLKRVRITAHTVRISPESVRALIGGGAK